MKYNSGSLKGDTPPSPATVSYTFGTEIGGSTESIATIDLVKK